MWDKEKKILRKNKNARLEYNFYILFNIRYLKLKLWFSFFLFSLVFLEKTKKCKMVFIFEERERERDLKNMR